MSVEFRYACEGEYDRVASFIDEHWAKDHIYVRNRALFEWTFQRPGYWDEGYSFALGEDGGKLVAILGGIPYTFNNRGTRHRGVWIVNYAVHPDYRKGTAALKLLSMFRNPAFPVVIASGLNPATVTIYKVLRGQVLPETPRHFAVMPGQTKRLGHLIQLANPEVDVTCAQSLAEAFVVKDLSPAPYDFGNELPACWDETDWPEHALTSVGAARDADYLSWRYLRHPSFEYRLITLAEGARTGLLVWRLETIRQQTDEGRVDVGRIGRVVEFLPASAANGRLLLQRLFQALTENDAVGADFYGYQGAARQMLASSGFHSADRHADGSMLPSRFQPIAAGSAILNAMFSDASVPACAADADCEWYWTKSDSDQDRPN